MKKWIIFLVLVSLISVSVATVSLYENHKNKSKLVLSYEQAFTELTDRINTIDNILTKLTITTDKELFSNLSAQLLGECSAAKSDLSRLPLGDAELSNTETYLSQIGDYTYSISKRDVLPDDKERDVIIELSSRCNELYNTLLLTENAIMDGAFSFESMSSLFKSKRTGDTIETTASDIEYGFSDYAALTYDGPFSSHITDKKSEFEKNSPAISSEKALEIIGEICNTSPKFCGEVNGICPSYSFICNENGNETYYLISKHGGILYSITNNRNITESKLTDEEAILKATDFLKKSGFPDFVKTGSIKEENSILISFCKNDNNRIIYPELVKVKVALDNGDINGFEAMGYYVNHKNNREYSKINIAVDDIIFKLPKNIEILNTKLAVIPSTDGKEYFCHEIFCKLNNKSFLCYYDTETGEERDILMYVETEFGELTV